MSLMRYKHPAIVFGTFGRYGPAAMTGGSLKRYHTPQTGRGFKEDLVTAVGPIVSDSAKTALDSVKKGTPLRQVGKDMAQSIKRGLKRKAVPLAFGLTKKAAKRGIKRKIKDVFGR